MLGSPENSVKKLVKFYSRYLSIRDLRVPTIAAINGYAIGEGMCLAMACDMRIASPHSKMGFTQCKIGHHPGIGVTHFLSRVAGPEVAARMLLTGEIISGIEARELNIIGSVAEDPLKDAIKLAKNIASAGTTAVQTCVQTLRDTQVGKGVDDAILREAIGQTLCMNSSGMESGTLRPENADVVGIHAFECRVV